MIPGSTDAICNKGRRLRVAVVEGQTGGGGITNERDACGITQRILEPCFFALPGNFQKRDPFNSEGLGRPTVEAFLDSRGCAKVMKAMGDATRLRILRSLIERPKSVGAIVIELKIEQPKASHHLAILRHAGLVQDVREGRHVSYGLHPSVRHLSGFEGIIDLGCCSIELKKE